MTRHVLALAGGVGGAKLAVGLARVLPPGELTIVVNTGDDEEFHGLHVSPDLDTVMYAMAGLTNLETGWGVACDTFNALGMLERYGAPAWFNLGDRDLATHVRRTQLLGRGMSLSEVTRDLCGHLGVLHPVVPMSDDPVRTVVETNEGDLPFQVYFVERMCEPAARGIRFDGSAGARTSEGFLAALELATGVVFCPSNPFLSVDPILSLPGVRDIIARTFACRVAVSPIVGGAALRGPAAKLLQELGHEVSCVGVARQYRGLCDVFIIDEADRSQADSVRALGMDVEVAPTIMSTEEHKVSLASRVCEILGR